MVFASYEFIFIFFPITILLYFLLARVRYIEYQQIFLILSSLVFYSWFNVSYLWIILTSIAVNYSISYLMKRQEKNSNHRKYIFVLGIIFNVLLLGYFKYYNFFLENINPLFNTNFTIKEIMLPLGISFFTFQQISFLISSFKEEWEKIDFLRYCLCVVFFPHLIAGPIVLYSELMPQFYDKGKRYLNWDNVAKGLCIFVIGLFKKIVIADSLAVWANNGFDHTANFSFFSAWGTTISYTLQIYFDFSGYSEMAMGLALMLNILLPDNFQSPYKSKNIAEFWRRWHITLGRALFEFIYKPLGGNRKGKYRTYLNLLITFIISGLWHGASWLFLLWGFLHGIANVIQRIWSKSGLRLYEPLSILLTFLFVNFTWVFFRANDFSKAITIIKAMVIPNSFDLSQLGLLYYDGIMNLPTVFGALMISIVLFVLLVNTFKAKNTLEIQNNLSFDFRTMWSISLVLFLSIIYLSRSSVFIYFNF